MPQWVQFEAIDGSWSGRALALDHDEIVTIGSAKDSACQIQHQSVSPHHAELSRNDYGHVYLTDMGSKTGTSVEDELVSPGDKRRVHDGTQIGLGSLRLRLKLWTEPYAYLLPQTRDEPAAHSRGEPAVQSNDVDEAQEDEYQQIRGRSSDRAAGLVADSAARYETSHEAPDFALGSLRRPDTLQAARWKGGDTPSSERIGSTEDARRVMAAKVGILPHTDRTLDREAELASARQLFESVLPQLLTAYSGQYAAIQGGKISVNEDRDKLIESLDWSLPFLLLPIRIDLPDVMEAHEEGPLKEALKAYKRDMSRSRNLRPETWVAIQESGIVGVADSEERAIEMFYRKQFFPVLIVQVGSPLP